MVDSAGGERALLLRNEDDQLPSELAAAAGHQLLAEQLKHATVRGQTRRDSVTEDRLGEGRLGDSGTEGRLGETRQQRADSGRLENRGHTQGDSGTEDRVGETREQRTDSGTEGRLGNRG